MQLIADGTASFIDAVIMLGIFGLLAIFIRYYSEFEGRKFLLSFAETVKVLHALRGVELSFFAH
jgi:hypothetical protein